MTRTASQRGRLSRRKGGAFERKVVNLLKARLPNATIRRGKQSHLADEPDVVLSGCTLPWGRLWLELQDSRNPTPEFKLRQAEADAIALPEWGAFHLPVVVWHRIGERRINASMRWMTSLILIAGQDQASLTQTASITDHALWTVDFADLLAVLP